MRIVVTVKFVPDLQSTRSFTDGTVTRTADDGTMNELDENAVEAALQLKESLPRASARSTRSPWVAPMPWRPCARRSS